MRTEGKFQVGLKCGRCGTPLVPEYITSTSDYVSKQVSVTIQFGCPNCKRYSIEADIWYDEKVGQLEVEWYGPVWRDKKERKERSEKDE